MFKVFFLIERTKFEKIVLFRCCLHFFFPLVDSNNSFQVRIICQYPMRAVLYLVYIAWFSFEYIKRCYMRLLIRWVFLSGFEISNKQEDIIFSRGHVFGYQILIEFGVRWLYWRIMMEKDNFKLHHQKKEM